MTFFFPFNTFKTLVNEYLIPKMLRKYVILVTWKQYLQLPSKSCKKYLKKVK